MLTPTLNPRTLKVADTSTCFTAQFLRITVDSRRYQIFWEVVGLERGPLSLGEYNWGATWMEVDAPVLETEINSRGDPLRWHPLSAKVGTNFADKLRSFGRYGLLAD
jgi:hypothetical protein